MESILLQRVEKRKDKGSGRSVGALSSQTGVSVRREQAVFMCFSPEGSEAQLFLIFRRTRAARLGELVSADPAVAKAPQFRRTRRRLPA